MFVCLVVSNTDNSAHVVGSAELKYIVCIAGPVMSDGCLNKISWRSIKEINKKWRNCSYN